MEEHGRVVRGRGRMKGGEVAAQALDRALPSSPLRGVDPTSGWRRFLLLWGAQTASMGGSGLTAFALGVWTYQNHHSASEFSFISF